MEVATSSADHLLSALSLPQIYFCTLCDKPYSSESSRDRHLKYCQSRTYHRPRSCRACKAAKAKCSFETPCSRCEKKDIDCIYAESTRGRRRVVPDLSPRASAPDINSSAKASVAHTELSVDDRSPTLGDPSFARSSTIDEAHNHGVSDPQSDINTGISEIPTLDELLTFEGFISSQAPQMPDVSITFSHKPNEHPAGWCDWACSSSSLAIVAQSPTVESVVNLQASLQMTGSHAQRSADLVVQSLRAFPTMMLRKETFPWFIHPQSHLLSGLGALPEALSTCMTVSQVFVSRTNETKSFLWHTIRAECQRFLKQMYTMSKPEILAASQACMIYLVMCIIDYSRENEGLGLEIIQALFNISVHFKGMCGGCGSESELSNPSMSWEDWIFAESQRRLSNLWLLIGCVVCVKGGNALDPSESYKSVPLPAPKSIWEASTPATWQSEYESGRIFQVSGLVTLGDLLHMQQSNSMESSARKLDLWNASVDNLGSLLNLVTTMV